MNSTIIYRCCESETSGGSLKHIRPLWFDKLKCLKSLLDGCHMTQFHAVHDGELGLVYNYLAARPGQIRHIHKINYESNEKSLIETFNIADGAFEDGADVVYFIEDDFLHTEDAVSVILNGAYNFGLVTGFDHLDRYKRTDDLSYGKELILFSKKTNRHWRTAESTTCTWACNKQTWNQIRDNVRSFKLQDRELFRSLLQRGIRLWTPIPGVSTTLDVTAFSPGIDWEAVNNAVILD